MERTCDCKHPHEDGICRWPTLKGRINNPITTRDEAVLQMKNNGDILSLLGLKYLTRYLESERISQPKVTLQEAKEQAIQHRMARRQREYNRNENFKKSS